MTDEDIFDHEESDQFFRLDDHDREEIALIEAYEAKVEKYGEDTDLWPDETEERAEEEEHDNELWDYYFPDDDDEPADDDAGERPDLTDEQKARIRKALNREPPDTPPLDSD